MIGMWLKRVILWSGLLLCMYALWLSRALAGDAIGRVSAAGWGSVALLLALSWLLSVLAWRQYLRAYTGHEPGWRTAMRQLGLLLIGKYIPGGVFGFLARVQDQTDDASRHQLFSAGLAEQSVGIAMPIALGGTLYLATNQHLAWLGLTLLLPLLASIGVKLLHHCLAWLPWLRRHSTIEAPAWRDLLPAPTLQLAQLLSWVALVAMLAHELYGLSAYAALGISGAFLLAIAAGMLTILAPGGIGVREAALVALASHWLDTPQAIFLSALLRLLSSLLDMGAGLATIFLKNHHPTLKKKS